MLRIGVVGAGRIGRVHAKTVAAHPNAKLVAISDPFQDAAQQLGDEYRARATLDAYDIFSAPDIDAVIVGSPTNLHAEHILAAVRNDKAVMCEKPVAQDLETARNLQTQLNELKEEGKDVRVMIGFNRRFDPSFANIHKRVEANEIGDLEQLIIISRDPEAPPASYIEVSGGIFKDMTIHDFDMARFFLGDITTVYAVGQNLDPALISTGDFDGAFVTLTNSDGVVCSIVNSRHCASGYDQRLEAFGNKGTLIAENIRATTVRAHTADYSDAQDVYLDFFLERYEKAYTRELSSFIEAITDKTEPSPNVEDGIKALELAQAATQSAREGTIVTL